MEKERDGFPLTSVREIKILMQCNHPNIVGVKVHLFAFIPPLTKGNCGRTKSYGFLHCDGVH